MNIKEIIDAERWSALRDIDYRDGEIISNAHNESLDRIEAVAIRNEQMLDGFREAHNKMDDCIRELEDELNTYKIKELAAQSEPSTWYDDSLKRRVKECEDKLEVRARLILSLRGYIADLERENTRLREKIIIKST